MYRVCFRRKSGNDKIEYLAQGMGRQGRGRSRSFEELSIGFIRIAVNGFEANWGTL